MFRFLEAAALAVLILIGFSAAEALAEVKTEEVRYTIEGAEHTGYMAWDDAIEGERPGVIVVHEWWGHNRYARKRAELLAALGYTAFALDMYGTGKLASHPGDAKSFMMESIESANRAATRFGAAYELLKSHPTTNPEKTAAIGYCFGGMIVLNAARMGFDLDGVVSYHGNLSALEAPSPGMSRVKVRVFNGADDPFVKAEAIEGFKAEMEAAGVDYEFTNYPGAIHSFTNPGATAVGEELGLPLAYNAEADGDSWMQTQHFFNEIQVAKSVAQPYTASERQTIWESPSVDPDLR